MAFNDSRRRHEKLETTAKGLSEDEAEKRLKIYGLNELKKEKRTRLDIFLNQFKSILIIVLLIATALTVMHH